MEKSEETNTKRLKEVLKELMYSGKVKSQRDFGAQLGYKPAFTSQMLSGHKSPADLPNKIYQTFGIKWDVDTKKPDPNEPGDEVKEPEEPYTGTAQQMPPLYEKIVAQLLRNSEAQCQAIDAIAKLSDALLEERQEMRATVGGLPANYASKSVQDVDHIMIEALKRFVVQGFAKAQRAKEEDLMESLRNTARQVAVEEIDERRAEALATAGM